MYISVSAVACAIFLLLFLSSFHFLMLPFFLFFALTHEGAMMYVCHDQKLFDAPLQTQLMRDLWKQMPSIPTYFFLISHGKSKPKPLALAGNKLGKNKSSSRIRSNLFWKEAA